MRENKFERSRKNFNKLQVTLHIAYIHAFVNPVLFLSLHRGLRQGLSEFFCGCCEVIASWILGPSIPVESAVQPPRYQEPIEAVPSPPEPPLVQPNACPDLTDVALLKPPLPPTGKHLLVLASKPSFSQTFLSTIISPFKLRIESETTECFYYWLVRNGFLNLSCW